MVTTTESEQTEISRSRLPILSSHKQGKFLDTSSQKGFEQSAFRIAVTWVKEILESRENKAFHLKLHQQEKRQSASKVARFLTW
jgi:hypothetical protein